MAKFSLLTSLTLSAAGFNKGINQAKKGAKGLTDGMKTAGSTIAGAFSPLQQVFGNLGGQLGGVTTAALGGVSAFKKMIPAINGVKTALIASGIGTIVVALGTAFGALMSYLKGTEEGASKLATVMGYLKGAFNAILQRVQLLGEAVSLIFEGKFKEAGEKLKSAFKGGLLQEIKDDAKEAVGYAERENKLWQDKLNLKKRESELQSKIDEAKLIIWDKDASAIERQTALNKAKKWEEEIAKERIRLAEEEYSIIKSQNAMGRNSRTDTEKEVELYAQINSEKSKFSVAQKEYLRQQTQINKEVGKELQQIEEIKWNIESLSTIEPPEYIIKPKIDTSGIKLEGIQAPLDEFLTIDSPQITSATLFEDTWAAVTENVRNMLSNTAIGSQALFLTLSDIAVSAIKQISDVLAEGGESFGDFAKNALNSIRSIIAGLISEGVTAAITSALSNPALSIAPWLIPAFAGLAAGLAKTAFQALIPKFHEGGIVGGYGDIPAILKPGEMVLTNNQQRNLFDMLNNGVNNGGEVVFRIADNELVGILQRYNRRTNSFR